MFFFFLFSTTVKLITTNAHSCKLKSLSGNVAVVTWAVMFPEDLPGHKTKPEQESPSASRPTNESFFARMLFACVTDSCMCYCGGFSALDFGEGQFFSANMSFVKARFQR